MNELGGRWVKNETSSVPSHEGPLRPHIDTGISMMQRQKSTFDRLISKTKSRDKALLGKVAAAKARHDMHAARMLASELVELRKARKTMQLIKLGLDKIEIRLTMSMGLGDTVSVIAPTMQLMRKLGGQLGKFIPEASGEINQMISTLGNFMNNSVSGYTSSIEPVTGVEVDQIMQEAAAIAGKDMDSSPQPEYVAPRHPAEETPGAV